MDTNTLYRVKHTILLQVTRDILIEKGLTSREEFNNRYFEKVDLSGLPEETKEELKKDM